MSMTDKLWFLWPEIALFIGACVVVVLGLSPNRRVRDTLPWITCAFLALGMVLSAFVYGSDKGVEILDVHGKSLLMPYLGRYVKIIVCGMGIALTLLTVGMVDRRLEAAVEAGRVKFDPIRANRGEFHAFFLLSVIGVMLVCNANDLIWLFLALELTSLPTYIMVAMSRGSRRAQEAAVKYFFLGAMATAMTLYGFALLYGATGSMLLTEMQAAFAAQAATTAGVSQLGVVGMILAVLGVSYKIAAAPMHFYAPDVYEGAASPVTAFLAFIPKTTGMLALILLLSTIGWSGHNVIVAEGEHRVLQDINGLPQPITTTLWMIAVLTMTLGNVGALLQKSVKRVLAYSSIAHSGYMLLGIIAGPANHGIEAVLFYLLAYGIMNTAAFAVLSALERQGNEIESMEDLAGLRVKHPAMAAVMALAAGSLLGVPPLLGFWGKLYLFIAAVQADQIALVVVAGLNSAVSAWYYLRLIALPIMNKPTAQSETIAANPYPWPRVAGIVTAALLVLLPIFVGSLVKASEEATAGTNDEVRTADAGKKHRVK
jgi:NADH-quinone oxidoreductase subunit N